MRNFGIEIEFKSQMARKAIAQLITDCGVPCVAVNLNQSAGNHWRIVKDESCGFEVVSPILNSERFGEVETVCNVLKQIGEVNHSCGLHVHIDARGLKIPAIKKVLTAWAKLERVFDSFQPQDRRGDNNRFCEGLNLFNCTFLEDCQTVEDIYNKFQGGERYFKVNVGSYLKYGTVEFRHHSGCLDAIAIINWVKLLQSFFSRAVDGAFESLEGVVPVDNLEVLIPSPTPPHPGIADFRNLIKTITGWSRKEDLKAFCHRHGLTLDFRVKASYTAILDKLTEIYFLDSNTRLFFFNVQEINK